MATPTRSSRTLDPAAKRRLAASSVAPVASGYERGWVGSHQCRNSQREFRRATLAFRGPRARSVRAVIAHERHRRQKARHDAGLRPGDRRAHARDGDRGGALPRRRRADGRGRRLRRSPARLRRGARAQAHQARARASRQGQGGPAPPARRVPRAERARHGRDRHRRGLRARREGQGHRRLHRQGLPGDDQAAQLQPRPRHARLPQRSQARLDRRLGHALARLQGDEDGRADGRQAGDPARAHRRRPRRRPEPAPRQGRGARAQERLRRRSGRTSRG